MAVQLCSTSQQTDRLDKLLRRQQGRSFCGLQKVKFSTNRVKSDCCRGPSAVPCCCIQEASGVLSEVAELTGQNQALNKQFMALAGVLLLHHTDMA